MNKIKDLFQDLSGRMQRVTAAYPITMILIILASLSTAIFVDQSGPLGNFMEETGLQLLFLWTLGSYCAETLFRKNKTAALPGIAAALLAAGGLVYLEHYAPETVRETAFRWQLTYAIVLVTLSLYRNYKNASKPFNQYCIHTVCEFSGLAIICAVTAIGIALVTAIFCALLLNGTTYMLIIRAEFLVMGCLSGFGFLDAQLMKDKELPRFFLRIVKYALMTMLIAAFIIIYGYILKIIITRIVPSNEIFRILSGLFLCGLPIWTMIGTYPEDHWLVGTGVKLPYLFIPFLFLQGYAIRERILAYGITPARYLCLMLMAFEIIYIIVYALRKRETGIMLPVFAGMAVISLVLPYGNMYSTSNRSQKAIFDRFIADDFASLPADSQSQLAGAYYYLAGNTEGEAMIASVASEKIDPIILSGKIGIPEFDQSLYVMQEFPLIDEPIENFLSATWVTTFDPSYQEEESVDPNAVRFFVPDGDPILTADLNEFLQICISAQKGGLPDGHEIPSSFSLEDGSFLRILTCSFTVQSDGTIRYPNITALLLK